MPIDIDLLNHTKNEWLLMAMKERTGIEDMLVQIWLNSYLMRELLLLSTINNKDLDLNTL